MHVQMHKKTLEAVQMRRCIHIQKQKQKKKIFIRYRNRRKPSFANKTRNLALILRLLCVALEYDVEAASEKSVSRSNSAATYFISATAEKLNIDSPTNRNTPSVTHIFPFTLHLRIQPFHCHNQRQYDMGQ